MSAIGTEEMIDRAERIGRLAGVKLTLSNNPRISAVGPRAISVPIDRSHLVAPAPPISVKAPGMMDAALKPGACPIRPPAATHSFSDYRSPRRAACSSERNTDRLASRAAATNSV